VPVGLSAKEEKRAREAKRAQEEEDEIAAFLPMLQDYLRSKLLAVWAALLLISVVS